MSFRICPYDSGPIPQVGQHRDWPQPLVRFYWCKSCTALFAFVGENEFGGRLAASFSREKELDGWRVSEAGSERDVRLAIAAIEHIVLPE